ncbi:hypothetical protein J1N35_005619 [Gossypium stocksii]|uniref:Uncharacterized protein n=1 Tax=Gossypium stocksii TaxID=47602 RepID=A0A9D3WD91_9ROSI|nr:hypothetical protein J1N35_005619 [Gossypium stocksii]
MLSCQDDGGFGFWKSKDVEDEGVQDSKEFGRKYGIVSTSLLEQRHDNDLLTLWSDTVTIVINWSFEKTLCKRFIGLTR